MLGNIRKGIEDIGNDISLISDNSNKQSVNTKSVENLVSELIGSGKTINDLITEFHKNSLEANKDAKNAENNINTTKLAMNETEDCICLDNRQLILYAARGGQAIINVCRVYRHLV